MKSCTLSPGLLLLALLFSLNVNCRADAIHDAAGNGDVEAVRRILRENHAQVNAQLPTGATPLLWACIRGQAAVVRLLIDSGADVNLAQGDGWTPLHAAVCDGNDSAHVEITRLLLDKKANIEAQRKDGWRPLHAAALKGNTQTLKILLERGADRAAKDSTGSTPLDLALKEGQTAAADMLLAPVRVSLHLKETPLADALQQLFAPTAVCFTLDPALAGTVTLEMENTAFPLALKALLRSVSGNASLIYRAEAGAYRIQRAETGEKPAVKPMGADPRYRFWRTISREVLNNILPRAVTHYGLCSTSPEPASPYFDDDMRMLTGLGAKFIGRAAYAWVPPDDDEAHYRLAKERAEKVHQVDPDMILQACVFEAVYTGVEKIPVPAWVFEEFRLPVEKRNFRYAAMLYDGGKYHNHWVPGASVPDMSKLETRLYFYYRARRYQDSGYEAIHFGQVDLMDDADTDHRGWFDLLTRLRKYALYHSRREMVLCDAHTHGVVEQGHLLFDFHTYPLIAQDVKRTPQKVKLVRLYYNSIYGRSFGGITPSGWACDHLPYMCEFDCGGVSDKPGQPSNFPWNWGYSCGDWFANQPEAYRKEYLQYADNWIRSLDEEAHLQMPTRLNLGYAIEGQRLWHANRRSPTCPFGFNLEDTIKSLWSPK